MRKTLDTDQPSHGRRSEVVELPQAVGEHVGESLNRWTGSFSGAGRGLLSVLSSHGFCPRGHRAVGATPAGAFPVGAS